MGYRSVEARASIVPPWSGEEALSPEVRAVLACARVVLDPAKMPDLREALAACPSVDRLCEAAIAHGMLGHLHRLVTAPETAAVGGAKPGPEAAVPFDPALVSRLGKLQRISAERNLRMTGRLFRLLDLLRKAGIEAMPYKGPALAERLYGDVTMRSSVDLDVIVRKRQASLARETLLTAGFQDGSPYNARLMRQARGGWGEVMLVADGDGAIVDLHWEIGVGFSTHPVTAGSLFARSRVQRLLGREVAALSDVDLLVASCQHGTRDRWGKVEGLLAVALQVRDIPAKDWATIMVVAREAGCVRRVVMGVAHACWVLGVVPPRSVVAMVDEDAMARRLLRSLTPDSLGVESSAEPRRELAILFWNPATEDSVAAGVRHSLVRLFRPGPEDWQDSRLPPEIDWLHRLLRPVRLAVKWAKRL